MGKKYKEANKCETETTINVLYSEKVLSIYTNKVDLERRLYKILGEPKKEYIKGRSVLASLWEIPLEDISKINKVILRADIYGM
ncbi:MAG: hypothetical protein J6M60_03345 [Clostridia bacterium]|nr:hypothetical protein [Clostridia bacterium]